MRAAGEEAVCTSLIVAGELRYGAARKGSARLTGQMEAVLGALEVLSLDSPVEAEYAAIRCEVERAGTPSGVTHEPGAGPCDGRHRPGSR